MEDRLESAIHLLLIEDKPEEILLMREMLAQSWDTVFRLSSVQRLSDGLSLLAEKETDVIILDLMLPDSRGLDTFERIHARAPHVPIIVLSKLDDETLAVEAVRKGAQDYLVKGQVTGGLLTRAIRYAIERKRAEEELQRQTSQLQVRNRELDAFAHTVAHDLKAPLALVIGFSRALQDQGETLSAQEEEACLERIVHYGDKMDAIIDELLLLASVRRGSVDVEPLDMEDIINEALSRLVYIVQEKDAEITVPERWPTAVGYAPWIEEVWVNYLSNALKHCDGQPKVELGATIQEDDKIRFWVRDEGPGIPADVQARLFDPFKLSARQSRSGYGFGLSIVQRIMYKLGGEVGVESDLGRGSTFYFILPAAEEKV